MPETIRPTILITGAAGNLGSLLAERLMDSDVELRLMVHRTPLPPHIESAANVTVVKADLADSSSLLQATDGATVVVHFAGVLFAARPEKFLPTTNTLWFSNLLSACLASRVSRLILISFPHVEGPTSVEAPATGRLDRTPESVHAQTRLEEERLLVDRTRGADTTPVILRLGMVYGKGILMVEAARWFARHRLLGVWKEPTAIHLISTDDYLSATHAAIMKPGIQGIYHLGDDQPTTLQHFLDEACRTWGLPKPWRMPIWMMNAAAWVFELFSWVTGEPSPLTRDFITIGRVSYFGDTSRARSELVRTLQYPTLESGLDTLK